MKKYICILAAVFVTSGLKAEQPSTAQSQAELLLAAESIYGAACGKCVAGQGCPTASPCAPPNCNGNGNYFGAVPHKNCSGRRGDCPEQQTLCGREYTVTSCIPTGYGACQQSAVATGQTNSQNGC